ncbi:hypothetical protein [Brachyspira hampsonii]|uniref:STAS domain-containing protein n=1 Tax=Brachyspira hampsonii 30446 TaxID=1289135 RepID=A0A2U4EX57_9SPIR|nr:hypothetical protein [Brachyspira hampsonii]EKV57748.1 hypothetical protein A966_04135 [Brachyspira hampsonii 30446]MBW5388633.1 hypothetical protein [Brachyspira hampsonii]MBW5395909.1 hypothetical protein [Brachyspira hampsonii]OEJ18498.1 hypothetical protein A9495_05985 [Brachyspira hampsonii]PTY41143.1 hypothetical protein DQ06_11615 [Brachyspira hampsonii bv. II]
MEKNIRKNSIKEYYINNDKNIILIIEKDINLSIYNELYSILNRLLENYTKNIIIHFVHNTKYIISNAIYLMIEAQKVLEFRGGNLILTGLNEYSKWSLKSLEAHKKVKIYDDIQKAIKEIKAS